MMDATIIVAIVAAISASICGPIVAAIIDRLRRKEVKKEEKEDQLAPLCEELQGVKINCDKKNKELSFCQQATHLLLKERVVTLTTKAIRNQEISLSTRSFIENSVELLHQDGENGEMSACLTAIQDIPTVNN